MSIFRLPLSGDVTQSINPWNFFSRVMDNQFGFININLGLSTDPEVEEEVLQKVGSYGRQLGYIGDALKVLIHHMEPQLKTLSEQDRLTLDVFIGMQAEIEKIKLEKKAA